MYEIITSQHEVYKKQKDNTYTVFYTILVKIFRFLIAEDEKKKL